MNDIDTLPLEMPEPSEPATRQRAVAQVRPIAMSEVVRDIARCLPFRAVRHMDTTYMSPAGFRSEVFPSWSAYVVRACLKRKAQDILRSESEVFKFLTNNTTYQEQAKQLLDIIRNVSFLFMQIFHYCHYCN